MRQKEQTIARFDTLAVTALRKHFRDDELNSLFRVLNRDLLETPIGAGGITVTREGDFVLALRSLLARVHDGGYRDENIAFQLRGGSEPLADLDNLDSVRQQLTEHRATLTRWENILVAIEQREKWEADLKAKRMALDVKAKRLFRFEEYQRAKSGETRLRTELRRTTDAIVAANERISKLTMQCKAAESAKAEAEGARRKAEDEFNAVMGRFDQCVIPEFSAKTIVALDVPNDFDAAISLFLRQQDRQKSLGNEIDKLLLELEQALGDEFRGQDDDETVGKLRGESEALVEKEDALARDWNAHLHTLKATFDLVLKNLGHVVSAASDLNRAFTKVRVSNLKAIKLEVFEQGDLVGWIRKLAQAEQPGLFDDDTSLTATLKNFRAKLEGDPVIRFADLFTLGVIVTGADNRSKTYRDFRQIESHGTTITIKVLFNLLLLKHQLRRDDCAVPFYLDEIEALDDPNREAILRTARQLGFIAITAAPKAVSEVDALYFLQPKNGRIVLRQSHRVQVKRAANSTPP